MLGPHATTLTLDDALNTARHLATSRHKGVGEIVSQLACPRRGWKVCASFTTCIRMDRSMSGTIGGREFHVGSEIILEGA